MCVVEYNIVIGLYVLDMWSVCSIVGVGSNVGGSSDSDWTVHTGHVVSVVCSVCGWWNLI